MSQSCQPFWTIPTYSDRCFMILHCITNCIYIYHCNHCMTSVCMTCLSLWRWRSTCRTVMFWSHTRPCKMVAMWSWGSWDVVVKELCTWGRRHLDETCTALVWWWILETATSHCHVKHLHVWPGRSDCTQAVFFFIKRALENVDSVQDQFPPRASIQPNHNATFGPVEVTSCDT